MAIVNEEIKEWHGYLPGNGYGEELLSPG